VSIDVEQPDEGILRLRLCTWQGTLVGYEVSAYVVNGVLIDTGPPHARRALLRALERIAPRGAIVTHWHEDHAGNVPALASRGMPMLMHADCERRLRAHPSVRFYRHFTWGRTPALASPLLRFDPAPLQIVHAPGHSPDHQLVWDAERRVLVSGDLFLGVKVRVAHASESPRLLVESLRAAVALEPRLLLDAHRGVVHNPGPLLAAKISWMEDAIGAIDSLHSRGVPAREIRRRVLGPEAPVGWASGGEYSKQAFVRAVLRETADAAPRATLRV
jgi:glyoxylase-like metal-dependent hydrolase (beta-lactamase superfamily II)